MKAKQCPYGIGFTKTGQIRALLCGQWSCEECRKRLAAEWSKRTYVHIKEHGGNAWVWHLTLRPDIETAYQGYITIKTTWDTLRKSVQRHSGKFSYLACVEAHPQRQKIPHFHVIVMAPAYRRINDLAYYAGFGYIAREEKVWSNRAAGYITKYASKYDPSIPKYFRRVRTSQDWEKLPDYEGDPLLVKSKNETLAQFIIRCAMLIDEHPDTLLRRYRNALNMFDLNPYSEKED